MNLAQRYRPTSYNDMVGQSGALAQLERVRTVRGSLAGGAYWITGSSGTGKTSLALLIAAETSSEMATIEIDGRALTTGELRTIERQIAGRPLGASAWAIVVNEAHALGRATIERLLDLLDKIPDHVVWIFTTTTDGQDRLFEGEIDAHPLLSRCTAIPLARRGLLEPFTDRALEIARELSLTVDRSKVEKRLKHHRNSLRAVLLEIESGLI